ncbi:MAG: tRNA dihydrouridine synthase [Brotaphodocola sp.]
MNYFFAPMEGITGYIYRNAFHQYFGHIDEYYTPFITPTQTRKMTSRELNDILPAHNHGMQVVPQILSNQADDFLWAAENMKQMGYHEVNLNLGCPSKTVVSKMRGSGFLSETRALDLFLNQICKGMEQMDMTLSIKTRIGKESSDEFEGLLDIYNQYPLKKLIIHPRVQTDYYNNHPNLDIVQMAIENSKNPVCYNGDLFCAEDVKIFCQRFPQVDMLMMGRGLLTNPALPAMVDDGAMAVLEKSKLRSFHDTLLSEYSRVLSGDRNVLFKMKELWFYMGNAFKESKKHVKKIRKAEKMRDYEAAVAAIFEECEIAENPVFTNGR